MMTWYLNFLEFPCLSGMQKVLPELQATGCCLQVEIEEGWLMLRSPKFWKVYKYKYTSDFELECFQEALRP